ncbi:hypothetical protein EVAR_11791_1 [Eumeta japonica]|uniref:Uncharacterized protein n=1 Tax=Eumeta variegata TaxID=151549 RepID=A0A4C1UPS3_EUMVA|nr:hypothetical protein EVAR_11791_1 [Eumeta japonica]
MQGNSRIDASISISTSSKVVGPKFHYITASALPTNLSAAAIVRKHPILGFENKKRLLAHILKLGEAGFPTDRTAIQESDDDYIKLKKGKGIRKRPIKIHSYNSENEKEATNTKATKGKATKRTPVKKINKNLHSLTARENIARKSTLHEQANSDNGKQQRARKSPGKAQRGTQLYRLCSSFVRNDFAVLYNF